MFSIFNYFIYVLDYFEVMLLIHLEGQLMVMVGLYLSVSTKLTVSKWLFKEKRTESAILQIIGFFVLISYKLIDLTLFFTELF